MVFWDIDRHWVFISAMVKIQNVMRSLSTCFALPGPNKNMCYVLRSDQAQVHIMDIRVVTNVYEYWVGEYGLLGSR